jgi:hypothetical protein
MQASTVVSALPQSSLPVPSNSNVLPSSPTVTAASSAAHFDLASGSAGPGHRSAGLDGVVIVIA